VSELCQEADCQAKPHRLVLEPHDFSGVAVQSDRCDHKWYTGSLGSDYPETTICMLCGLEK
jgi:hypothetical protein